MEQRRALVYRRKGVAKVQAPLHEVAEQCRQPADLCLGEAPIEVVGREVVDHLHEGVLEAGLAKLRRDVQAAVRPVHEHLVGGMGDAPAPPVEVPGAAGRDDAVQKRVDEVAVVVDAVQLALRRLYLRRVLLVEGAGEALPVKREAPLDKATHCHGEPHGVVAAVGVPRDGDRRGDRQAVEPLLHRLLVRGVWVDGTLDVVLPLVGGGARKDHVALGVGRVDEIDHVGPGVSAWASGAYLEAHKLGVFEGCPPDGIEVFARCSWAVASVIGDSCQSPTEGFVFAYAV